MGASLAEKSDVLLKMFPLKLNSQNEVQLHANWLFYILII